MVHEQGVGPRTLSRLTGVPYSVVQRATSKANEQKLQTGVVSEDSPPTNSIIPIVMMENLKSTRNTEI